MIIFDVAPLMFFALFSSRILIILIRLIIYFCIFDHHDTPQVREELPGGVDVVAFQCRNPVHRAHYELFTRALDAPNVGAGGVVMVHPTCGPTQADDIDGDE
jgi:hypothetical protein